MDVLDQVFEKSEKQGSLFFKFENSCRRCVSVASKYSTIRGPREKKARPRLKSLPLLDRVTSGSDLAYILYEINIYHKQSVEC